jgi:hypothetical protein
VDTVRHVLEEIGQTHVEIFPKQDALDTRVTCGNFINLPFFWLWVKIGRTVFVSEQLIPYSNQWDFLEEMDLADEGLLDWVIEMNDLKTPGNHLAQTTKTANDRVDNNGEIRMGLGLPPCAQRMLTTGVTYNQRVAAFRLAVQLRKAGLSEDLAVAVLQTWALKNRPLDGKAIIMPREIQDQIRYAFRRPDLRGCGCHDETVNNYCDRKCPIYMKSHSSNAA